MALPFLDPSHPVGTTNPVTVRAAAALPAAGAWDATPTEFSVAGFRKVMLFLTYTRGAAGGAFDFQPQVSPYNADQALVEDWFAQSQYAGGVLAPGADTQSRAQREYITYGSQGVPAETFAYGPIELGGAVERLRIPARESGDIANPGTLHLVAVLFS